MCAECGGQLPPKRTSRRMFCSLRCKNRAGRFKRVVVTKKWRQANPEKVRSIRAAYRQQDAEYMRSYYERNPERFADARHLRRARLASVGGAGVSGSDWNRLVVRYGGRCAYCLAAKPLTVDHIIPISRGGQHAIGNVLPACEHCNKSKGARLLIEWLRAT